MADEIEDAKNGQAKKSGNFLVILQEMEENEEHKRSFSGSMGYPGFIRAIYSGRVQMRFEEDNKK